MALCVGLAAAGCGGILDAGRNVPHGPLPVDERNPVIIHNDSATDNWMGEYALLLAKNGGPSIAGIIVCSSNYWKNLDANVMGWTSFVNAARASGFENVPDLTVSSGTPLAQPADGQIDSTLPNRSAGAEKIIALSGELAQPSRPVVVLAGAQLTDLADAYLVDHTVVDRVVVVSSLGSLKPPRALMTGPNGDLDPWADWIVAQRFKYVQVSAFYDQTADVTPSELTSVPQTPLGSWITAKQPQISTLQVAADQVAVLSVAVPQFAAVVQRSSADTSAGFGNPQGQGPPLAPDESGNAFVVTQIKAPLAASLFWQLLLDTPAQGS
jgi:hypothetical protein